VGEERSLLDRSGAQGTGVRVNLLTSSPARSFFLTCIDPFDERRQDGALARNIKSGLEARAPVMKSGLKSLMLRW
jgi:hypothetical protein